MRRTLLSLALPLLAACHPDVVTAPGALPELKELPRPLTASERRLIDAGPAFGLALLREVDRAHRGENVFISPLSASMALGMTLNGARGATLDSMRAALGFGDAPLATVNASYRSLIDLLRGLDQGVDFRIANSVWYDAPRIAVLASFASTAKQYFDAQVSGLDFRSPSAVAAINDWVKAGTNGKIETIIDGSIPDDARVYLINAMYFKGTWRDGFARAETQPAPFAAPGGAVTASLMHQDASFRYAEDELAQVVELPYGRGAYVMTVVLPREGVALESLVGGALAERWARWTSSLHPQEVKLWLPKFRLEFGDSLNAPLRALGMGIAFSDSADFTGMANRRDLAISRVLQKTFVDVYEEGTEAAAVTAVEIGVTSAGPPTPVTVRVDRPFVFALRERLSGTLLFLGKIVVPRG